MDDAALPTGHGIGSEEKVELMRLRYEQGLPLFLADDSDVCERTPGECGRSSAMRPGANVSQAAPRDIKSYRLCLPYSQNGRH